MRIDRLQQSPVVPVGIGRTRVSMVWGGSGYCGVVFGIVLVLVVLSIVLCFSLTSFLSSISRPCVQYVPVSLTAFIVYIYPLFQSPPCVAFSLDTHPYQSSNFPLFQIATLAHMFLSLSATHHSLFQPQHVSCFVVAQQWVANPRRGVVGTGIERRRRVDLLGPVAQQDWVGSHR